MRATTICVRARELRQVLLLAREILQDGVLRSGHQAFSTSWTARSRPGAKGTGGLGYSALGRWLGRSPPRGTRRTRRSAVLTFARRVL